MHNLCIFGSYQTKNLLFEAKNSILVQTVKVVAPFVNKNRMCSPTTICVLVDICPATGNMFTTPSKLQDSTVAVFVVGCLYDSATTALAST